MLDSTLKGESANSYVSVEEANEYFSDRPYGFGFPDEDIYEACLVHATQIIDRYVDWYGEKATAEQRLSWPRKDITDNADEIPFDIKMATFELAFTIKDTNILSSSSINSFNTIKVSTIQLKISNKNSRGIIPTHILPLIEKYGHTSGINCPLLRV